MVVGGLPDGSKDIAGARAQVTEATAKLLEHGTIARRAHRAGTAASRLCGRSLLPVAAVGGARSVR